MQGDTCVNKKLSEIIGMDRTFLFGAPSGLKFLADGNLEFINSIELSTTCEELQLGQCSK